MKEADIRKRAPDAIRACFSGVPFIRVKQVRQNQRRGSIQADLLIDLELDGGSLWQIVAEIKTNGQPRMAREAVNQLLRWQKELPAMYGMFVAPFISLDSAQICEGEGIGYADIAGNCRISFDRVFLSRTGLRNPFAEKRDLRSLYAPKSSRVLRVLLMRASESWKTQALSREAGVSIGQVANVRKLLRDREWIAESDPGFKLTNPQRLLAAWSENYTFRKNVVRDFYSLKGQEEVEEDLARACEQLDVPYAFSGFSAARRVAPAVRGQRVMAYVSTISEGLLQRAGLKEVASGANVSLMVPYDEGVYYKARQVDSLKVVCPVQLYLDLKGDKGRGEEAAEAVWKQELSLLW